MNTLDKIKTTIGNISLQEEGIIRYEIDGVDEITKDNLIEYFEAVENLGKGKSFCNLVLLNKFVSVGSEARKVAASEENNRYTIADAFVTDSVALKLVGNFYMRYDKPVRPTKLFTNEEEALTWLRTFL